MYDIYKGNQDDYLQFTKGLDICDQNAVNVTFDLWVEGDGVYRWGYYWPYDYVDFEIYSHRDDRWYNPNLCSLLFVDGEFYAKSGDYYIFDTSMDLYHPV